jgi:hypothetical protein
MKLTLNPLNSFSVGTKVKRSDTGSGADVNDPLVSLRFWEVKLHVIDKSKQSGRGLCSNIIFLSD